MSNVTYLGPQGPVDSPLAVPTSRVRLRPATRLNVEQARAALELLDQTAGADLSSAMYLLGLLTGHAQSLLDVIDTVTEVA